MAKIAPTIFLALSLTGCASIPDISSCSVDIFSYQTSEVEGVSNTIYLCLEEEKVLKQIYFPNTSGDGISTICRSRGAINYSDSETARIESNAGVCENGRSLNSSKMDCVIKENSMTCNDLEYGFVMVFRK